MLVRGAEGVGKSWAQGFGGERFMKGAEFHGMKVQNPWSSEGAFWAYDFPSKTEALWEILYISTAQPSKVGL